MRRVACGICIHEIDEISNLLAGYNKLLKHLVIENYLVALLFANYCAYNLHNPFILNGLFKTCQGLAP